jgi:epsilon-lactone hydrolase
MWPRIHFHGLPQHCLRNAMSLSQSVVEASLRRSVKGPRLPGWNWFLELGTQVLNRQLAVAFRMRDVNEARRYLDSIVIDLAVSPLSVTSVSHENFRGSWFAPTSTDTHVTLLYFHGGGYSFYPKAYAQFITLISLAAKSKTFALDYRLSPEYRFPAQLEDALASYRWLLENGTNPDNLVVGGDSAGGNLTLSLVLAARDANLPLPAFAFALSPATGFEREPVRKPNDRGADWIDEKMFDQWADWFCDSSQRANPLVSPVLADLRGLPPIYIQAGRAEILYERIKAFAERARAQRADVVLDSWDDMNHVFQIFGPEVPQSAEALRRLGEVFDIRIRDRRKAQAFSTSDP